MWLLHEMKCDKNFDILELRTLTIVSWYHFIISGSRWTSSPGCRSSRSPQMISDPRQVRKYHDQNIVFLKRKWSSKNIIQLSLLKNWNDLSFNCVETGSSWGSNLTSCKKWLGEQETTLERDKKTKSKKRTHSNVSIILQGESSGRSTPNSDSAPGKLFVGGLSWQTNQERLREYFGQFGTVTDVLVMKDPITQVRHCHDNDLSRDLWCKYTRRGHYIPGLQPPVPLS